MLNMISELLTMHAQSLNLIKVTNNQALGGGPSKRI